MVKMEILWTHCYECKYVMRLLSIDHCRVKLYLKSICKTLSVEVFLCDSADRNKIKMKVNIKKYLVIGGGWLLFVFCSYSPKNDSLSG